MTKNYHPVSLHVIRGALEYGDFKVNRIRTIRIPTPDLPIAVYRVVLDSIGDESPSSQTPEAIRSRAASLFARDAYVAATEFSDGRWSLIIRVSVEFDPEIPFDPPYTTTPVA